MNQSNFYTRRLIFAAATLPYIISPSVFASLPARQLDPSARLKKLEAKHARLGVCFLDTGTGELVGNRLDEHFAFCSTFKLPLVAACLREFDRGQLDLEEVLRYSKSDLLPWAPVTGKHIAKGGLSIATLAQAAQELSDGVAANLLVKRLGGPVGVTQKFREMGDNVTRLDRYEPDLGMVLSGDLRDTTTPRAMAQLVQRITTGSILRDQSRQRLLAWMENTRTGTRRLRAGLPADWRTGNKTGTGRDEGTTNKCNDLAITYPPKRTPIIMAAYFDSGEYTQQVEPRHEAVLAEVGRIAAAWAVS
jgi:beta-lactamase class A